MKLLILDNYDSFTYNLVHLVEKVSDISFEVKRNDEIGVNYAGSFDKILLSPGPGLPGDAGILKEVIDTYKSSVSILGVCLGQQAIGEVFGGKLKNLDTVYHGVATAIQILQQDNLFDNCPAQFKVGRYHSWVIDPVGFPEELEILATDSEKNIMAIRHKSFDVKGIQFHPESILSEYGETILNNWLNVS
ncbi:MAG: anthranilate synthase subunit [Bacteroidetes bacterium]|nr:anthranilate synthase subunit [Bacteroidota bacterium]